jgi:hypothetical protein
MLPGPDDLQSCTVVSKTLLSINAALLNVGDRYPDQYLLPVA